LPKTTTAFKRGLGLRKSKELPKATKVLERLRAEKKQRVAEGNQGLREA
jgi:hypothetical protein